MGWDGDAATQATLHQSVSRHDEQVVALTYLRECVNDSGVCTIYLHLVAWQRALRGDARRQFQIFSSSFARFLSSSSSSKFTTSLKCYLDPTCETICCCFFFRWIIFRYSTIDAIDAIWMRIPHCKLCVAAKSHSVKHIHTYRLIAECIFYTRELSHRIFSLLSSSSSATLTGFVTSTESCEMHKHLIIFFFRFCSDRCRQSTPNGFREHAKLKNVARKYFNWIW